MQFLARWFNGLGEETISPVRAMFTGSELPDKQFVVVYCPRRREYIILDCADAELQ